MSFVIIILLCDRSELSRSALAMYVVLPLLVHFFFFVVVFVVVVVVVVIVVVAAISDGINTYSNDDPDR